MDLTKILDEIKGLAGGMQSLVDSQKGFENLNMEMKGEVLKISERITVLEEDMNKKMLEMSRKSPVADTLIGGKKYTEEEVEMKGAFLEFMRKGKCKDADLEQKLMATDDDPSLGYMVPTIFNNTVKDRIRDFSPIRQLATVITMTVGNKFPVPMEGNDDFDAGWVSERQARPETNNGKIQIVNIDLNEMYAQPVATRNMLDDAGFNLEQWIQNKISSKFARMEGAAFVNGNGDGKPFGLLVSDRVTEVEGNVGGTTQWDDLITFQANLRTQLQNGAVWIMSRLTLAYLRTIKTQDGAYIWQPGTATGLPPTMLGKPYTVADDMPDIIDGSGDLVVGSTPIVYGNIREGYDIIDKGGLLFIRDELTSKPNVKFYYTKRVGGDVVNDQAIFKFKLKAVS